MTALRTHSLDDYDRDLLALIADGETPLSVDLADKFREACRKDAAEHGGWVHPNHVTARLVADDPDVNKRRISALWSTAEAPGGYLRKTDQWRKIDGSVSRGNGNKSVRLRWWIGSAS